MTPAEGGRRVLHAISEFGTISQSFLVDRLVELERTGWEAWVGTLAVTNRELFPYPPDERVLRPARPALPARVVARFTRRHRRAPSWPIDRYIARARPQLVHAHFGWTAAQTLPAVKRAGLPLVAGFHGYDATVFPRYGFIDLASQSMPPPLRQDPYRRLFDEVDCVLAVSRFIERKLRELGFTGRVEVVPSGIRLHEFPFRGVREDDRECRVLFVGRLVPYKGLDVLIRALAQLKSKVAGLRLDVVGDGPTLEPSRMLARELGLADRIAFHGARPRTGVVNAMQASDILVAPSKTMPTGQAEGLSNVVKEALAVGLPLVASDNGGIPEVVPPPYREELVPENDADALADRLAAIVADRGKWQERASIGREWVESTFDWGRLAPRIASVYDELTASRHAQAS